MHISAFPEINGMKCCKWAASDVFEERDAAYRLLAKMATGNVDYGEERDLARQFFKDAEEEPRNYYDEEEEEEEAATGGTPEP